MTARKPAAMASPIYVTQPELPPLEEFLPYLQKIWDTRVLSNGGPFHQMFEAALCEHLGVRHISLSQACPFAVARRHSFASFTMSFSSRAGSSTSVRSWIARRSSSSSFFMTLPRGPCFFVNDCPIFSPSRSRLQA